MLTRTAYINRGDESCKLPTDCSVCAELPKVDAASIAAAGV